MTTNLVHLRPPVDADHTGEPMRAVSTAAAHAAQEAGR